MAVTIASNRTALKVGHGSLGLMPTSWLAVSFSRSERDWNCRACAQECRHVHTSFSHGVSETQIDWSPGRVSRRLVVWGQSTSRRLTRPGDQSICVSLTPWEKDVWTCLHSWAHARQFQSRSLREKLT